MKNKHVRTILLIEDDPDTADALLHKLGTCGCRLIHTGSGSRAIEILRTGDEAVDLVLMDIEPGQEMDGADAAGIIIKSHNLPVIFMHSGENNPAMHKTGQVASYGYVNKNTDAFLLNLSINAALKRIDIQKESEAKKKEELRSFDEK